MNASAIKYLNYSKHKKARAILNEFSNITCGVNL